MKNLIRFLWMKERFNHLWTFLVIWLTGTLLIVLMEGDEERVVCCVAAEMLFVASFRFNRIINVFFDKTNFLLPVGIWQKYLSILLFEILFSIVVWMLAGVMALLSGKVVLLCMGYGADSIDMMRICTYILQHNVILAYTPFACLVVFSLYVYKDWFDPFFVFLGLYKIPQLILKNFDGIPSDQTIVIVLLLSTVVMLPVSWFVFKHVQYDRIKSHEMNGKIWKSGEWLKS